MAPFAAWQNFYVIMGSSAGALIGLQFVVLSFITGVRGARLNAQGTGAFATPAIVHFAAVLALSGILCAPWDGVGVAASLWGLLGAGGIVYVVTTFRRIRGQAVYRPVFEDWLFHILLPFAAYLILAGAAYAANIRLREALFGVGAAALLLLFSSIHNAWDAVTYHVHVVARQDS